MHSAKYDQAIDLYEQKGNVVAAANAQARSTQLRGLPTHDTRSAP